MIELITTELGISVSIAWALVALVATQIMAQVWALVDLVRRARVRYDMKWLWALIIIVGGNMLIGPIVYVAFGRNVPEQVDVAAPAVGDERDDHTRHAVDTLYGPGEDR